MASDSSPGPQAGPRRGHFIRAPGRRGGRRAGEGLLPLGSSGESKLVELQKQVVSSWFSV